MPFIVSMDFSHVVICSFFSFSWPVSFSISSSKLFTLYKHNTIQILVHSKPLFILKHIPGKRSTFLLIIHLLSIVSFWWCRLQLLRWVVLHHHNFLLMYTHSFSQQLDFFIFAVIQALQVVYFTLVFVQLFFATRQGLLCLPMILFSLCKFFLQLIQLPWSVLGLFLKNTYSLGHCLKQWLSIFSITIYTKHFSHVS